ncbi:hypothetical protein A5819_002970 [Enterococcus sp. 7E2_DIV0204]|uniref:hypothetical protein n=1 Tax=unclassified Enterococcus TaxID=2608891 RepID=UPI000B630FC1|nr:MULTISPECIES: hypothetical protein [unclassified Enterococcus]OTN90470.1 hypothetical protein A5819_002970 [Enterococcus sp. 7E2_DIV0204]OTP52926.1 hypothetical protein A5884_002129 [Enterococcus sp. 7D2_DIV0200]
MTELKVKEIETLVVTAKEAQSKYENYTQEQVDAIVKNVYQKTLDNAEKLAISANEETGLGKFQIKSSKIHLLVSKFMKVLKILQLLV